jgi:hypothetical protein
MYRRVYTNQSKNVTDKNTLLKQQLLKMLQTCYPRVCVGCSIFSYLELSTQYLQIGSSIQILLTHVKHKF